MPAVTIDIKNKDEWNLVHPMAEVEATKQGRRINPALKFTVRGLKENTLYEPRVYFHRSEKKFSFGSKGFWTEWSVGEEQLPLQYASLGPMNFSAVKISTDKEKMKSGQIFVQSHHVYHPTLVITCVTDPSEAYEFTDERLKFVVVTKATPRLKTLREELKRLSKKRRGGGEETGAPKAKRTRVEQEPIGLAVPEEGLDKVIYLDEQGAEYYVEMGGNEEWRPVGGFEGPISAPGGLHEDYQLMPAGEEFIEYEPLVLEGFGGEQVEDRLEHVDLLEDLEIRPDSRVEEPEEENHLDMDVWDQRYPPVTIVIFNYLQLFEIQRLL